MTDMKIGPTQLNAMAAIANFAKDELPRQIHGWTYTFTIGPSPDNEEWATITGFEYRIVDTTAAGEPKSNIEDQATRTLEGIQAELRAAMADEPVGGYQGRHGFDPDEVPSVFGGDAEPTDDDHEAMATVTGEGD